MKKLVIVLALLLLFSGCNGVDSSKTESILEHSDDTPIVSLEPLVVKDTFVTTLLKKTVSSFSIDKLTDEEKIRFAYEYLISNVHFADPVGLDIWRFISQDTVAPNYLESRTISPLLFDIGSCEDFATTMVLLLREMGIESEYIAGYTLSIDQVFIDHAWAMVNLEGNWYHLDPQLEQNVTRSNNLTYRYYLKSDEDIKIDHLWGENLISHFEEDMTAREKYRVRSEFTPHKSPTSYPQIEKKTLPLPLPPNMAEVEQKIKALKNESGVTNLTPILLKIEPPILVSKHHITPPLLPEYLPFSTFRYGKTFLDGEELKLYDSIEESSKVFQGSSVIVSSNLNDSDMLKVAELFSNDYPEYYWLDFKLVNSGDGTELSLVSNLELDWKSIDTRQKQTEIQAYAILSQLEGNTPYEITLSIHDFLASHISYDYGSVGSAGDNIYGALIKRSAYCDGFAKSFQYLIQLSGLDPIYIKGLSVRSINHAWNAVKLDNNWYYFDITWDRPRYYYDEVYHDYFAVSLEEINRERTWNYNQYPTLPPSDSNKLDYYLQMNYAIEEESPTNEGLLMSNMFFRQLTLKDYYPLEMSPVFLEIKIIGNADLYEYWKGVYIKEVFNIVRTMEEQAKAEDLPFTISYDTSVRCDFNDAMQVLTFHPKVQKLKEAV